MVSIGGFWSLIATVDILADLHQWALFEVNKNSSNKDNSNSRNKSSKNSSKTSSNSSSKLTHCFRCGDLLLRFLLVRLNPWAFSCSVCSFGPPTLGRCRSTQRCVCSKLPLCIIPNKDHHSPPVMPM